MRKGTAMVSIAIFTLCLAAPAVMAQDAWSDWNCRVYGIGCTMHAVRSVQNIIPNLLANQDLQWAKSDFVYAPGQRSRAADRLWRWQAIGQPGAFEHVGPQGHMYASLPSYGSPLVGGFTGMTGMPLMGGYAGFPGGNFGHWSQVHSLPLLGGRYGVGFYGDLNSLGPGFLDHFNDRWMYHTFDGRRHRVATQGEVRAWGAANLGVNVAHFVHDIIQERSSAKRQAAIQGGLTEIVQLQAQQIELLKTQLQLAMYRQPVPTYQPPAAPQQAPQQVPPTVTPQAAQPEGVDVINETGCHVLLVERSGRWIVSRPGYVGQKVMDPIGLRFDVKEDSPCVVHSTMSADRRAITLTCGS